MLREISESARNNSKSEVSTPQTIWESIKTRNREEISLRQQTPQVPEEGDLQSYLLEETDLSSAEIAQVTGLSPAYIGQIKRGIIKKAGRDKLIILAMIALNLSLAQTNALLKTSGYPPVDEYDAKVLAAACERKSIKGVQVLRSNLSLSLLFLALESIRGDIILVHQVPDPGLLPPEFALAYAEIEDPVYASLMLYIHRKRREFLLESLERDELRCCMVCEHCFRKHIRWLFENAPEDKKEAMLAHLRATILTIEKYPNFRVDFLNACQRNWFRVKSIHPDPDPRKRGLEENSKVVFVGRPSHSVKDEPYKDYMKEDSLAIRVIATDNKKIFRQFFNESERLIKNFVRPIADIQGYIADIVEQEAKIRL